ncbi:unnamed protein product, partial [Meganyctiphanes norvegica]
LLGGMTLRGSRGTFGRTVGGRRSCCWKLLIVGLATAIIVFFCYSLLMLIPKRKAFTPFPWTVNVARNLSAYILPDTDTTLIQPLDICQPDKGPLGMPFILFVIPSAINNTQEREIIRQTWGLWADNSKQLEEEEEEQQSRYSNSAGAKPKISAPQASRLLFLLGRDHSKTGISAVLVEESQRYADIIVEDFIDSYSNLTLKTVFILKWVHQNCPGVKFLMKADDDMFVNVPNLQKTLMNQTFSTRLIMGSQICGARPIHSIDSKWYTPQHMYNEKVYPNYVSGTGYVMSGDVVEPLLKTAAVTPYFHLEDVFLTGICAKAIGLRPQDNRGFSYQPRALSKCLYKKIITSHQVNTKDMQRIWSLLNQENVTEKCKPLTKKQLRSYDPGKCTWK